MSSIREKVNRVWKYGKEHGIFCLLHTYFLWGKERMISCFLHRYNAFLAKNQWCWTVGSAADKRTEKIIVSMTSYPARIPTLAAVFVPLFRQSMPPDKIILTLAESQFPGGEADLPQELLALKKRGLEIFWAKEDLRSHKKYYYVMQNYPDANIITVDDDIFYRRDMIAKLWEGHLQFPQAVIAHRIREITWEPSGQPMPYVKWPLVSGRYPGKPNCYLATSGGGTLFPPRSLHKEIFHREVFMKLCPYADDLWLKMMSLLNDTPIVATSDVAKPLYTLAVQQKDGLADYNYFGGNDKQFAALLEYYKDFQPDKPPLLLRMQKRGIEK